MKKYIDLWEYAGQILDQVGTAALVTAAAEGKVNTMTIAWGTLGIEWKRPIFVTMVRENRFTRTMLDENPEFTINVPIGDYDRKIAGYCGRMSGRDTDKIADMNLTLEPGECVSVPAICQFPLTLECKVLYKQLQDKDAIPQDIKDDCYPQDVDSTSPLANKDFHIAYYAEIVKAYIIK